MIFSHVLYQLSYLAVSADEKPAHPFLGRRGWANGVGTKDDGRVTPSPRFPTRSPIDGRDTRRSALVLRCHTFAAWTLPVRPPAGEPSGRLGRDHFIGPGGFK
jgi:hypothetical protein